MACKSGGKQGARSEGWGRQTRSGPAHPAQSSNPGLTLPGPYLTVLPIQDLEGLQIPGPHALGQHLALEVQL